MEIQKSYKIVNKKLYIIPTPIGNLEDITYRAIRIMREEIDYLLCEDTRNTGKLLHHYEIKCKMVAYHEHNKDNFDDKLDELYINSDSIGLVSDAGMPGISDPGFEIITYCRLNNIDVIVLPGASAFILGVIRSNFPNSEFTFSGFLKGSNNEKKKKIQEILKRDSITAIYESTHKIIRTLEYIKEINNEVELCIGRELTKINEEYIVGKPDELIDFYSSNVSKGEFIIIFNISSAVVNEKSIDEEYNDLIDLGFSKKEAIKNIAKNRNLSKNEVYMMFIGV